MFLLLSLLQELSKRIITIVAFGNRILHMFLYVCLFVCLFVIPMGSLKVVELKQFVSSVVGYAKVQFKNEYIHIVHTYSR